MLQCRHRRTRRLVSVHNRRHLTQMPRVIPRDHKNGRRAAQATGRAAMGIVSAIGRSRQRSQLTRLLRRERLLPSSRAPRAATNPARPLRMRAVATTKVSVLLITSQRSCAVRSVRSSARTC